MPQNLPKADDECEYCGPTCLVGVGYCHCGCGGRTKLWGHKDKRPGHYAQFVRSHHTKLRSRAVVAQYSPHTHLGAGEQVCVYCGDDCAVGFGFCHCGCGTLTRLAKYSNRERRCVIGMPRQFVNGHNTRKVSDERIAQIRREYLDDESATIKGMARKYNLSHATTRRILRMLTRKEAGIADA